MAELKKTQLAAEHERSGGKMVDFGGWWMPVRFAGTVEEHLRVRSDVGIFDVSHMGEILISGADALPVTNSLVTNNVAKLERGQALYTCMCYETGGIVDDLLVYRLDDGYLLVVNAANIQKDYAWIREHADGDISLANQSHEYIQIAIQGPRSPDVLAPLTDVDLETMGFYRFSIGRIFGLEAIVSRTGYTGEDGFEIYVRGGENEAERIWLGILDQGRAYGIMPVGLGARDTLRLEMGYCLYGNDITQDTTPLEAGLGWVTKLKKGPFIGRDSLLEQKAAGVTRRLAGFTVDGRSAPRLGYDIQMKGESVGTVTSGVFSPSLEKSIGLGYVSIEALSRDEELYIDRRGKLLPARRVKLPFYTEGSHL